MAGWVNAAACAARSSVRRAAWAAWSVARVADQDGQRDVAAQLAVTGAPQVGVGPHVVAELGEQPVAAVADDGSGQQETLPAGLAAGGQLAGH